MKSRRWRLKESIGNGYGTLAIGTEVLLTYKRGGFNIQSVGCKHCGVALRMLKVPFSAIEELVEPPTAGVIDERCNNY